MCPVVVSSSTNKRYVLLFKRVARFKVTFTSKQKRAVKGTPLPYLFDGVKLTYCTFEI